MRLREERRREPATPNAQQQQQLLPPQQQQQPRSFTSRRSSTDSSEEGFNLNVRDLKVHNYLSQQFPILPFSTIVSEIIFHRLVCVITKESVSGSKTEPW